MSAAKQRGTAAETAVVRYLQRNGWPHAERRTLSGANDKGDIAGVIGVCLEVKATKAIDLAGFVDEAEVERINAEAAVGAAWIKRRGKGSPAEWYVAMTGEQFVNLLREAGY